MRLVCPNCGAQYEVPDGVIPDAGRDVQCSNCGNTWYQHHPDNDPDLAEELQQTGDLQGYEGDAVYDAPPAPQVQPQRRQLDPSIAEVLREEAEREARARAAEAATPLESQPDLGLDSNIDPAERRAQQVRSRMARMRGEGTEQPAPQPAAEADSYADPAPSAEDPAAQPAPAAADSDLHSRRDLLPDIDEINSSLRNDHSPRPTPTGDSGLTAEDPAATSVAGKGGFGRGFLLALVIFALLFGLYTFAPQIAAQVPAAEPTLTSYVDLVDQGRVWLDTQLRALLIQLDQMTVEQG